MRPSELDYLNNLLLEDRFLRCRGFTNGRGASQWLVLDSCLGLGLRWRKGDGSLLEEFWGLGERSIVGYWLEIGIGFVFLGVDGFEEQRLPAHVHVHDGDFPQMRADFLLRHSEGPPFVQVAQKTGEEFHFTGECTVDGR